MTKPLNTQNEWIILTLIRAVAGFCLVSLDVKQKYTKQSHGFGCEAKIHKTKPWHGFLIEQQAIILPR